MLRKKKKAILNKAIRLAAISGLRAMSAPALLSGHLRDHPSRRLSRTPLRFMQSKTTAKVFNILAAAEMIGDKLPATPDRIRVAGLIGRGLSGALVGTTLARSNSKKELGAAGLGAASAIGATFLAFYLRKILAKNSVLPDTVWGAVEDIFVIQSGRKLFQK